MISFLDTSLILTVGRLEERLPSDLPAATDLTTLASAAQAADVDRGREMAEHWKLAAQLRIEASATHVGAMRTRWNAAAGGLLYR